MYHHPPWFVRHPPKHGIVVKFTKEMMNYSCDYSIMDKYMKNVGKELSKHMEEKIAKELCSKYF